SGLPSDRFHFFGFLPPKSAARKRCLEEQAAAPDTLIFYESPHRIGKFLGEIEEVLGPDRCVCLARELTKRHETILAGPVSEVRAAFAQRSGKGEFVLLVAKDGYKL
ncbi:MAG: 16S rRNA (cytidine(1402)-2'-O)-methyltransferase, partial [Verrucomicrobia bacterium]|nr:16S rRNA (cytidine(1402)-2'-O)-methyltransferase [Verrucomicrobiota bacterium]